MSDQNQRLAFLLRKTIADYVKKEVDAERGGQGQERARSNRKHRENSLHSWTRVQRSKYLHSAGQRKAIMPPVFHRKAARVPRTETTDWA